MKFGVPFWGPNKQDYSMLGSILGSTYLGNLTWLFQISKLLQRCENWKPYGNLLFGFVKHLSL